MPKRDSESPEDFAKVEDKFKLSLLNMEKRFVDLEMVVSELNDRLKTGQTESIQALNKRMDDIEDLILVEQAGLTELKNLMERAEGKFDKTLGFDERLDKKIKDVEKKATTAEELAKSAVEKTEKPIELSDETKERIAFVEKEIAEIKTKAPLDTISPLEIGDLKSNVKDLEGKLSAIGQSVKNLRNTMDEKIKAAIKDVQIGTAGFEFMNSKIESLKAGIDMLGNKRVEMDMKISDLDNKLSRLEKRGKDSLPDKLLDEVKMSKRELGTNKIKIESLERVVRELTANMQDVETKAKGFESLERLTNLKKEVDGRLRQFKFLEEEMTKLSNRIEVMYNDLDKRLMSIRTQEKDIKRLSNNVSELIKVIEQIRVDMKSRVKRKEIERVLHEVEEKVKPIDDIAKVLKSTSEEVERVKKGVKVRGMERVLPKGFEGVVNDLNARMSEIEKALEVIKSTLTELGQKMREPSMYDVRLKDLIDKFVFLESRIGALESMLQRTQPIILE